MIKVIAFAVVGLLLGLGSGTGVAIMKARKATPVAGHAADSAAANHDSSSAVRVAHGTEPAIPKPAEGGTQVAAAPSVGHVDSARATPSDAQAPHESAPGPQASPARTSSGVPSATGTSAPATPGRIAKIFAAMSPRDAARVLEQLDDTDVQTVLSGLNDRQAAAILAGFTPARAAAISRAAIRAKKGDS